MTSFFLWMTLGLAAFASTIDGSQTVGCPNCDCCGCCETGTCKCTQCTCECCVDECSVAGGNAAPKDCRG